MGEMGWPTEQKIFCDEIRQRTELLEWTRQISEGESFLSVHNRMCRAMKRTRCTYEALFRGDFTVADQGFPRGRDNLKDGGDNLLFGIMFLGKLHENKKNGVSGTCIPRAP